jgi:hypothetical protein
MWNWLVRLWRSMWFRPIITVQAYTVVPLTEHPTTITRYARRSLVEPPNQWNRDSRRTA